MTAAGHKLFLWQLLRGGAMGFLGFWFLCSSVGQVWAQSAICSSISQPILHVDPFLVFCLRPSFCVLNHICLLSMEEHTTRHYWISTAGSAKTGPGAWGLSGTHSKFRSGGLNPRASKERWLWCMPGAQPFLLPLRPSGAVAVVLCKGLATGLSPPGLRFVYTGTSWVSTVVRTPSMGWRASDPTAELDLNHCIPRCT